MPDSSLNPSKSLDRPADLTIIGGGPTGLFAAFYAGLRQMSVILIESLDSLGGQLGTLYPEKYIYDVAGFPKILAKDLVHNLIEQGLQFKPQVHLGEKILSVNEDLEHGVFQLRTSKGEHLTRAVLIAGGIGAFQPKTLPLPNAPQFVNRGLHYIVKDPQAFANQRILIVGGGDSAVDWANALAPLAKQVTLIHRRDHFRAHEDSVQKMRQSPAQIKVFHELKSIAGKDHIEQATIVDNRTHDESTLDIDAILVNIGFNQFLGPIKDWNLDLDGGQILVNGMMQTSRPGIFAAGDIVTYAGKLKLIATGFGEACIAVNFAKHYLDPKANIFPGHSTNMMD